MSQFLFLQQLLVTLRTLLGEQEPGDIRSLAARENRQWVTHRPQSHDLVAHVDTAEEQPAQIAAVQKKEPSEKKKFEKFGGAAVGHRWWPGDGGFWFWLWFRWTDSL
jgi:hypothetical protein